MARASSRSDRVVDAACRCSEGRASALFRGVEAGSCPGLARAEAQAGRLSGAAQSSIGPPADFQSPMPPMLWTFSNPISLSVLPARDACAQHAARGIVARKAAGPSRTREQKAQDQEHRRGKRQTGQHDEAPLGVKVARPAQAARSTTSTASELTWV